MRILLLFLCFWPCTLFARIHTVGTGQAYASPNALYQADVVIAGDTIDIHPGTYSGQTALAVWHPDNLLIRGIGTRPHLRADGQNIWGKGIWVLAGHNIIVENMEFSGAAVPDKNGAGIRLDGTGLTTRFCYFHNNETGILTSNPEAGDILVEYCEFGYNGNGDGFSHNIYVGRVHSLVFQFNYSHHASVGHNLKSRAAYNYILYNRIMDEATGNSSRLIDLPNGGTSILVGNVLMQGPNAPNSNMVGYGLEGLSNPGPHRLVVVNNTFVNKRPNSGRFLDFPSSNVNVSAQNNIFGGPGILADHPLTTASHNIFEDEPANLGFADEPAYDYHLTDASPALDQGTEPGSVGAFDLAPVFEYAHPVSYSVRIQSPPLDAGAYEFNLMFNSHVSISDTAIHFYATPTENAYIIEGSLSHYHLTIQRGDGTLLQTLPSTGTSQAIDLDLLPSEMLILEVRHKTNRSLRTYTVLKSP
ncbi:MAG: right-handed parallel beta-helix repeat-containing protein [Saprospiraceae bacterium]|nr:right-handed parallel beta-helix repeat-containing protein [Saprospiraceae bacterium]